MVLSVSYWYCWRVWVRAYLISQTTTSNNTIHFCDFYRESVYYRICCLIIVRKNVPLLSDNFRHFCLQCSVTLCDVDRFGSNHLHKLAKGLPSYILWTGSGRTDGRDVYRVTRKVPMAMSLVMGRNYGGVCRCSAVLTLVREGGVGLSFWTQNPKVG